MIRADVARQDAPYEAERILKTDRRVSTAQRSLEFTSRNNGGQGPPYLVFGRRCNGRALIALMVPALYFLRESDR